MNYYDLNSHLVLDNIETFLRGRSLSSIELKYLDEDIQLQTKMWIPLRKLYRQHLFHLLLPQKIKNIINKNLISVLNISPSFYCSKANPTALIERAPGLFGRPCPECIGKADPIKQSFNIEKIKALITILKKQHGLQIVTFVGQGEPLEKDGHRETILELISYVYKEGLIPLLYTGGHTLDARTLEHLKKYKASVLLSTYGLPFLESDIFDPYAPIFHYSNLDKTPEGIPLLFSQRDCAKILKELFSIKESDLFETNLAISMVITPQIAQDVDSLRHLQNFKIMAKISDIAVFAWEEYKREMTRAERKKLEKFARGFSSWCELGSLYVWNRCRFGTGGSVTILGNGEITHCPHTTTSTGLSIEEIVNDLGYPIPDGILKLTNKAHEFDHMACILRGVRLGQRNPAVIRLQQVVGNVDIYSFLQGCFLEFTYIYSMWAQEEKIDQIRIIEKSMENLYDYFTSDYLWSTLLIDKYNSKNNSFFLSPAQRYLYDEKSDNPTWSKIASSKTGHHFHNSEMSLLKRIKISSKIIGNSIVFLGIGKKEDMIIADLPSKNRTIYLVDVRKLSVLKKAHRYEKMGFNVQVVSCLFEEIGNNSFLNYVGNSESLTIICLGCTIGNFQQDRIWESLIRISNNRSISQIIFSLQVTHSIDREEHIETIKKMYNENTFQSFIFNSFDEQLAKSRIYFSEKDCRRFPLVGGKEVVFDKGLESGLGGIVGKIKVLEPIKFENQFTTKFTIPGSTDLELYRSLKPDLINYIKYLRMVLNKDTHISVLGIYNDVALLEVRIH